MIPKWYAAFFPTGRLATVQPSLRKAQKAAGAIFAGRRNAHQYGSGTPAEWRKAKAKGWTTREVSVR